MTSESGRLSRKLDAIQRDCNQAALLAARALYGGRPADCGSCGVVRDPALFTPLESDRLETLVNTCYSGVKGRLPGSESQRISGIQQRVEDAYNDQFGVNSRFVQYQGPVVLPVCPPIPTEILNANIPKASLRSCPLLNKGTNPVLPT